MPRHRYVLYAILGLRTVEAFMIFLTACIRQQWFGGFLLFWSGLTVIFC